MKPVRRRPELARIFLAGWLALPAGWLGASGTRVDYVDAFATGRGNAFSATADNASAVYYNPAGLTQLEGTELQAGTFAISLRYEHTPAGGGAATEMDDAWQFLPSLFAGHHREGARWAAGLGVYAPFGLATDWPDAGPFLAVADKSKLTYLTLQPVLAWEVAPGLSIGAGPTINRSTLAFDQALAGFHFDGEATSWGGSAGVLWKPADRHALAVVFRSGSTSDYEGDATLPVPGLPGGLATAGRAEFAFPEYWRIGYSFRPSPQWNLEVNGEWTHWEVLDRVNLETEAGVTVPFVFEWDSSWFWEFGATRELGDGWHVSAGYAWVENSVPESTFTPVVPDSHRGFFSLGLGGRAGRWRWEGVAQYGTGSREVAGPAGAPPGYGFGGLYQTDSLAFNVSLSGGF